MHDELIRYTLDGEIVDSNLEDRKARLVRFLESGMRDEGVLPSLDVAPHFTLDYHPEVETYQFLLSIYGVWVGVEKAWQSEGATAGKMMSKSTVPSKWKVS
jgi:hypothetical protein